jgi:hypothetical protein
MWSFIYFGKKKKGRIVTALTGMDVHWGVMISTYIE